MDDALKADPAARANLAYVVQTITGDKEFSGGIELDFRGGGLWDGRPSIPLGVNRKELGFLVRPLLPTKDFSGTVFIGANLGVVNHFKFKVKTVKI